MLQLRPSCRRALMNPMVGKFSSSSMLRGLILFLWMLSYSTLSIIRARIISNGFIRVGEERLLCEDTQVDLFDEMYLMC